MTDEDAIGDWPRVITLEQFTNNKITKESELYNYEVCDLLHKPKRINIFMSIIDILFAAAAISTGAALFLFMVLEWKN